MQFSKVVLAIAVAVAAVTTVATAQQPGVASKQQDLTDQSWIKRSSQIVREAGSVEVPDWLLPRSKIQAYEQDAKAIYQQGAQIAGKAVTGKDVQAPDPLAEDTPEVPQDGRVTIFASLSIPEKELRDLVREATLHADKAVIVFRGVEKGKSIDALIAKITKYIPEDVDAVPNIEIDPNHFKRLKISVVPYISYVKNGNEYLARGIYGVDWILRRSNDGADPSQDYGRHGPVYQIKEPDMVDEMKRRWAAMDMEKVKSDMIKSFWTDKMKDMSSHLPDAIHTQVFEFDPTVEVAMDIPDMKGGYLARAGDRINPAHYVPLQGRYIFFNGAKKNHLEVAKRLGREALKSGHPPTYITAFVSPKNGWEDFQRQEETLDAPVTVLDKTLAERFKIERLPAMLYFENGKAWIKEYNVSEFLAKKGK